MKLFAIVGVALLSAVAAVMPAAGQTSKASVRIYVDEAHGEAPLVPPYAVIAKKLGVELVPSKAPITDKALAGFRLLYLRVPQQEFTQAERDAIAAFVKGGGALLLDFDEERRAPLATTRVNDLIAPFSMTLTDDTEVLHNTGAIARTGVINAADRELPFSAGRVVGGGTPFGWQLDKAGQPGKVFAAYATVGKTGKVVVLGDAMVTLFLGTPEGVRLTGVPGDPTRTTYWGKDSGVFMEELIAWLIK